MTGVSPDPVEQLKGVPGNPVPREDRTGRFATAGWQHYARVEVLKHAAAQLPPGTTFPETKPPTLAQDESNEYHSFGIDFSGAEVGLGMDTTNTAATAQSVSKVQAGIQYHPTTNEAWLVQLFPSNNPKDEAKIQNSHRRRLQGPTTVAIPSATIRQQDIPMF